MGDWGQAVMLELRYTHPRHCNRVEIRRAVRREPDAFTLHTGQRAELVCWGVMPSGMLRHPLFVRWLTQRQTKASGQHIGRLGSISCRTIPPTQSPSRRRAWTEGPSSAS